MISLPKEKLNGQENCHFNNIGVYGYHLTILSGWFMSSPILGGSDGSYEDGILRTLQLSLSDPSSQSFLLLHIWKMSRQFPDLHVNWSGKLHAGIIISMVVSFLTLYCMEGGR